MKLHNLYEARYYQHPIVDWIENSPEDYSVFPREYLESTLEVLTKKYGQPDVEPEAEPDFDPDEEGEEIYYYFDVPGQNIPIQVCVSMASSLKNGKKTYLYDTFSVTKDEN